MKASSWGKGKGGALFRIIFNPCILRRSLFHLGHRGLFSELGVSYCVHSSETIKYAHRAPTALSVEGKICRGRVNEAPGNMCGSLQDLMWVAVT